MINILIRADSNSELGDGHISRCITLANSLSKEAGIHWLCHSLSDRQRQIFTEKQYSLFEIPSSGKVDNSSLCKSLIEKLNINVLIYDSYSLGANWQSKLNLSTEVKVVCFDDLANRNHAVDLLIDASPARNACDYQDLVPLHTKLLVGSQYISIKEMTTAARGKKVAGLWHIFFGAGDPRNLTAYYLSELLTAFPAITFNVVVGNKDNVPAVKNIQQLYRNRVELFITPSSIDESLVGCSLAIGAPGIATWERLSINLPCILLSTKNNQIEILKLLERKNIISYLGQASDLKDNIIKIKKLLKQNFQNNLQIPVIDSLGTQRIKDSIQELHYVENSKAH